jgi:hypothetical protein
MKRKPRTETELRKASDHLHYEISMFQSLVQGMASGIAGNSVINNSLLESFGIHVRALVWFFYAEKPYPDDVIAEDFFLSASEWQLARPSLTQVLETAKKRADKEIAHLTYARLDVTPEQKPWEFLPIFSDMNRVVGIFLNTIPEHLLGERWNDFNQRRKAQTQDRS